MAQVSEIERRRQAERRLAEIEGRVKGLKRVGKATEAAAQAGEAKVLRQAIAHAADAALDANRAQVRLVQVYAGGDTVYVFDMRRVGWPALTTLWSQRLAAHGAGFELKNLAAVGIVPEKPVECTLQMSGLLLGTHRRSLLSAAAEYLNLSISKKEQTSDWSAPNLSQAQLDYAALDAVLVVKLAARMLPALGTMRDAYLLQRDAQAAVAEMELRGILLDVGALNVLMDELRSECAEWRARYLSACHAMGRPDLVASGIPETPEGKRSLLTELLTEDERRNWKKTPGDGKLATSRTELLRGAHYPPIAALARLGSDRQVDIVVRSDARSTGLADHRPSAPVLQHGGRQERPRHGQQPTCSADSAGSPVPPALSSGARERARWRRFRFDGIARGLLDRG